MAESLLPLHKRAAGYDVVELVLGVVVELAVVLDVVPVDTVCDAVVRVPDMVVVVLAVLLVLVLVVADQGMATLV